MPARTPKLGTRNAFYSNGRGTKNLPKPQFDLDKRARVTA